MFRVRKSNIPASSPEVDSTRPRQPGSDVQTNNRLHDDKIRDDTPTTGRQRKVSGSNIPSKKRNRQKAKPLAMGNFGSIPNAKRAIDVAAWYWETYQLVVVSAGLGKKMPLTAWGDIENYGESIADWNLLTLATTHDDTLEHNYACLTGPSGVTVIDYDDKETALADLDTFTVDTPRGRHQYLRVTDGEVHNSVNRDLKIDVRSEGGIAILPPSHGANGTLYRLTNDAPIKDITLADWLVIKESLGLHNTESLVKNEVGWFTDSFLRGAEEGERNNTCAKLAGYLVAGNLSYGDVEAILSMWNGVYNIPPLPDKEIERTVRSICNKHEREKEKNVQTNTFEHEDLKRAKADPDNRFA